MTASNYEKRMELMVITAVVVASLAASLFPISNYDFWWILSDGRYVVDNMEIPKIDVFRFASIGKEYEWFNHLYLTGSIFYLIYLAGGFSALSIFKSAIVAATFSFLYATLRLAGRDRVVLLILLLLAIFTIRFRLLMRPDIFTFLFFVSTYYIVERHRKGLYSPLFMLPFIMFAWVNLHAGYIAGLMLLITVIASEYAKIFIAARYNINLIDIIRADKLAKLSLYSGVSVVAIIANPYGMKAYAFLTRFLFSHAELSSSVETARVGEWQPLSFFHFKGLGICFTSEYGVMLLLFILSTLLVLKKLDFTDLLLCLGFVYASTVAIRFIPVAAFVIVPYIYKNYRTFMDGGAGKNMKKGVTAVMIALSIAGVGLGVAGLNVPPKMSPGIGVKEDKFPGGAVDFIKSNNIDGNIFNSYGIGGYLIWRFYPERRVFMDGRVLDNIGDYYEMIDSSEGWKEIGSRYDFDVAFIDNDRKDYPAHLFSNPDWKIVYWDDNAVILLKDIDKYRHIIDSAGYVYTMPTFRDFGYLEHYLKSKDKLALVEKELIRNINSSTQNSEARLALAFLYLNSGKRYYDFAFKQLKKVVRISPDLAMAHSALGWLYLQRGMKDEGVNALKKALYLDPYDAAASKTLSQLAEKER